MEKFFGGVASFLKDNLKKIDKSLGEMERETERKLNSKEVEKMRKEEEEIRRKWEEIQKAEEEKAKRREEEEKRKKEEEERTIRERREEAIRSIFTILFTAVGLILALLGILRYRRNLEAVEFKNRFDGLLRTDLEKAKREFARLQHLLPDAKSCWEQICGREEYLERWKDLVPLLQELLEFSKMNALSSETLDTKFKAIITEIPVASDLYQPERIDERDTNLPHIYNSRKLFSQLSVIKDFLLENEKIFVTNLNNLTKEQITRTINGSSELVGSFLLNSSNRFLFHLEKGFERIPGKSRKTGRDSREPSLLQ